MDRDWNSGSVTGRDRDDNYIPWSKKHDDIKKQIQYIAFYRIEVPNVYGDWY